jgi:hypothetical protein
MFIGWDAAAVSAGPAWSLELQNADPGAPLLTQPTWSARFRSFYVATASKLVRIELDSTCRPRVAWQTPLGDATLYPSPTVAGGTVWVPLPVKDLSGVSEALLGIDARTGRVQVRRPVKGVSFAPPTALPGMLFVASMHGLGAHGFPVAHGRPATNLARYKSVLDAKHQWQSREDGVYSTDDGGKHWRRIYPRYATRVLRLSATTGVISVGSPGPACQCATRQLWTQNGGRTWRVAAIGERFAGRGSSVYWWTDTGLFQAAAGLRSSTRLATTEGRIVSGTLVDGGIAALVDRYGRPPQVIVATGSAPHVVTLPMGPATSVVRSIRLVGSQLVVRGTYLPGDASAAATVDWSSPDGGMTWMLAPLESPG